MAMTSSGEPQWQVDIPGLSQMVLSAGAQGLKQLALSGVDIHTVGCMLMVSELIPASQEFRQAFNHQRQRQRTERQWLYNLVEIGASSYFLLDQFLKTRAGENVLALMSSIGPLVSEDACSFILSQLFEVASVPNDHTPGLHQFSKLRNGLLVFARKTGFQEKVLQHHVLFGRLSQPLPSGDSPPPKRDPFDAMPAKDDIPRIVHICHKLAESEGDVVLVFRGFCGSGWVAMYASFVLGLLVCAVDASGYQVPINNDYGRAKVIIDPAAPSPECELLVAGKIQDCISVKTLDEASRRGWTINCNEVNFLSLNHPDLENKVPLGIASRFVAIATLNEVVETAHYTSQVKALPGFLTYFVSVLPQIQDRALEILFLLGFQTQPRADYQFHSTFYCQGTDEIQSADFRRFRGTVNVKDFRIYINRGDDPFLGRFANPSFIDRWADSLLETFKTAILFASQLAFTDWNTNLQTMSARSAHGRLNLKPASPGSVRAPTGELGSSLREAIVACTDTTDPVTLVWKIFTHDWVGVELDGVVVLRNLVACHSISKAEGKILSLLPGNITFEGQQRNVIRMKDSITDIPFESIETPLESLKPENVVPSLSSRFLFKPLRDTLWLRLEILQGFDLVAVVDPIAVEEGIKNFLTVRPCEHLYGSPLQSLRLSRKQDDQEKAPSLHPGFAFHKKRRTGYTASTYYIRFYYQQVNRNELGQWLACQWNPGSHIYTVPILQKDTCLDCTISRIVHSDIAFLYPHLPSHLHDQVTDKIFCIIAGGSDSAHPGGFIST